jgi:16S rRNA (cytosine1402-N4)-methyltransferase
LNLDTAHIPVLQTALVEGIALQPQGLYLDATVGGGGHTLALLERLPEAQVWAIDRDATALTQVQRRLSEQTQLNSLQRVQFWQGNFATFQPGALRFDGIMADLGVSSMQFDSPDRGFSFRHPGPLDMRMDQSQTLTAAEIINTWQEAKLAEIFYVYGEERLSRSIAKKIVAQRPFATTVELAETIGQAVPSKYRYGRIHPATRVFQALRIVVNGELTALETFLQLAPNWLKPGGRLGMISFHSLEDRLVKHGFKGSAHLQVITKKPIVPSLAEVQQNPRARSAKLRLAERK